VEHWRQRGYEAEQQRATMQARLESLTAQYATPSRPPAVVPAGKQENAPLPLSSAMLPLPLAPLPPPRQGEWDTLVGGMLQVEAEHRLGRTLSPEQAQRLLETLSRLRDASMELSEEPLDPSSPHDQLMHTPTLLEVDRTFRDELGIGVSDFLQGLDGDQIEEVAPAGRVAKPLP
jgi:hypothetical protein